MRRHAQEKEGARVGGGWPRRGRARVRRKEVILRTTTWAGTVRIGNGGLVRKELVGGLGSSRDGTGSRCQRGEGAPGSGGHPGGCRRDRCRWSRRTGGKTGLGGLRAAGQGICGIEGEAGQWAEEGGPHRAPKGVKRGREGGGCQPEAWGRTGAWAGEGRPPPRLRGLRSPAGEPGGRWACGRIRRGSCHLLSARSAMLGGAAGDLTVSGRHIGRQGQSLLIDGIGS